MFLVIDGDNAKVDIIFFLYKIGKVEKNAHNMEKQIVFPEHKPTASLDYVGSSLVILASGWGLPGRLEFFF